MDAFMPKMLLKGGKSWAVVLQVIDGTLTL